jgi:hypothetical protein
MNFVYGFIFIILLPHIAKQAIYRIYVPCWYGLEVKWDCKIFPHRAFSDFFFIFNILYFWAIDTIKSNDALFSLSQQSMDLPPDKAKLLKNYDNEKKWDIICDQVRKALAADSSSDDNLILLFSSALGNGSSEGSAIALSHKAAHVSWPKGLALPSGEFFSAASLILLPISAQKIIKVQLNSWPAPWVDFTLKFTESMMLVMTSICVLLLLCVRETFFVFFW